VSGFRRALTPLRRPAKPGTNFGCEVLAFVLAILAAACHHRQPVPTTPAPEQIDYAAAYPGRLHSVRDNFTAAEAEARRSFAGLRSLPSLASRESADEVAELVRRADAAGRSQPYVDEALHQEDIAAVMNDGQGAIRRRVGRSVASFAKERTKEKECLKEEDLDALAGAASAATDRSVGRQLEARLRAQSSAHAYLRAHADELGEQKVPALARQADAVSRASFISYVRLALYRLELDDLLDQQKAVRTTLERDAAEGRGALASDTLSKSHRLAVEEQVAKDEAARQALDGEIDASERARQDMEGRESALQQEYRAVLDAVLGELQNAQAAPARPNGPAPATTDKPS
jgi:hypothetical protein